jgi:conjugal transfer pilus assembly protein TraB
MTEQSTDTLKKQKLNLIIAACIAGLVIFFLGKYIFDNYHSSYDNLFQPKTDLPIDEFKSKEVWMDRLESQLNFITQKQSYYEETLLEYKKKEQVNEIEKIELKRHLSQLKKELEESSERITQAESARNQSIQNHQISSEDTSQKSSENTQISFNDSLSPPNRSHIRDPFATAASNSSRFGEELRMQEEIVQLKSPLCEYSMPQEDKNELFPVEKRTPANISVKAILISSVDAVCRLDAQSDPIPVKLRLLDDGHLPGGITVKLKNALIGASAYGDISSERVYMRLENLTKVNPDGQAIETEVTGYVSGEDGKYGMRGVVVDRSAKILKPALGSGILSGIAQTMQAACTRPSRETVNAYTIGNDLAANSAAGTADAFSMLASYYIRRAEQVQPVLQVDAGRIVDVTFMQGFSMGDINAKATLKRIREKSRNNK